MNLLVELAVNYLCPLVVFFAHELHGLTRIVSMDKWRPGRSHELALMQ